MKMKIKIKIKKVIIITIVFFPFVALSKIGFHVNAENGNPKWRQVSGQWGIEEKSGKNVLSESRLKTINWGYNEIINYNSIISIESFPKYNRINFNLEVKEPINENPLFQIILGMQTQMDFTAIRLLGYKKEINQIQFVESKREGGKGKYHVTVLYSNILLIQPHQKYNIDVRFFEKKAVLRINNSIVREYQSSKLLGNGYIGFSVKDIRSYISDYCLFDGRNKIFEDDFKFDSIARKGAKIEKSN